MLAEECTSAHTQSPAPVEAVGRPWCFTSASRATAVLRVPGGRESGEGSLLRIMLLPDEDVHSLS